MAKMAVNEVFKAYTEAIRLRANHPHDGIGAMVSVSSRFIMPFLDTCREEIEIPPEVETAIRNIQSIG